MKLRLIVALLIFGIAIAASVVGYHVSRNDTNEESTFGDFDRPDRVELTVWITHVDPTLQNLSMTIMSIQPFGKFSKDGDFADDATMSLNSIGDWRFDIKRGESAVDDKVQAETALAIDLAGAGLEQLRVAVVHLRAELVEHLDGPLLVGPDEVLSHRTPRSELDLFAVEQGDRHSWIESRCSNDRGQRHRLARSRLSAE